MVLKFIVGLFLMTFAALADTTAPANCTPYPVTFASGSEGTKPASCPAFAVAGATLTSVTLAYRADYQFGNDPGPNTVLVTFVPAGPGGVSWSPASQTLNVTGGGSSGAIVTGGASTTGGVTSAAFAGPFSVNISSAVTVGAVATSSGAVTVVYTYTPAPAPGLSCPASTGIVGTPYTSALVATGGVPPYTYSIILGSLPPVLTLNPITGAITGTPTTEGPFNFTAQAVDSRGNAAGTTTANCTITISITPPPPPPGNCNAASPIFSTGPTDAFQIAYAANIDKGDAVVNISNNGAQLTRAGSSDNLCVNIYTFSPDEQLVSCCACPVTPNGLNSLSVRNDLISQTLTGVVPNSVVIKLVATQGSASGTLATGMGAWGTTIHPGPSGVYATTENRFRNATLNAAELASITQRCAFIQGNGSGYGICRGCVTGGKEPTKR